MNRLISFLVVMSLLPIVGCGGGPPAGPPRNLVALTVQPGQAEAKVPGGTVHFSATGTYDQAPITQANVTARWESQSPGATIDPATGVATCSTVPTNVIITATATGEGGRPIQGSASLNCLIPPSQLHGRCVVDPSSQTLNGQCVGGEIGMCFIGDDLSNCPEGQQAVNPDIDHICQSPNIIQSDFSTSCVP